MKSVPKRSHVTQGTRSGAEFDRIGLSEIVRKSRKQCERLGDTAKLTAGRFGEVT
jgi:hypothetical protein